MNLFFPEILGVSGEVLVMELGGSPITKPHRDLVTALRVLHDAGVVHLDLQPANILEDLEGRAGQSGSMWHSILHFIRHIRSDILFGILSGTSGISSDILSWRLGSWPGRLKLIDFGDEHWDGRAQFPRVTLDRGSGNAPVSRVQSPSGARP